MLNTNQTVAGIKPLIKSHFGRRNTLATSPGQTFQKWDNFSAAGNAAINSGQPLSFNYVNGSGILRRCGSPAVNNDPLGWSAIATPYASNSGTNLQLVYSVPAGLTTLGMFGSWFRLQALNANRNALMTLWNAATAGVPNTHIFSATVKTINNQVWVAKDDGINNNPTYVQLGNVHQWFYVWMTWTVNLAGSTETYNLYGMTRNGGPVLIDSTILASNNSVYLINYVSVDSTAGNYVTAPPWTGRISGTALFSLQNIAAGAVYPLQTGIPQEFAKGWQFATGGSTANDGITKPWPASWSLIQQEAGYGTFMGNGSGNGTAFACVQDLSGNDQTLNTVTTRTLANSWRTNYLAGQIRFMGDAISIQNGMTYSGTLNLQNIPGLNLIGCGLPVVSNTVTLGGTFTQPNSGTYPLVWQATLSAQVGATLLESGKTMNWVTAANAAASYPLVNATPGSVWLDPTGTTLIFSTFAGGNPNSDGLTRTYVQNPGGANPANDVVSAFYTRISGIVWQDFTLNDYVNNAPISQSIAAYFGSICVIENCYFNGYGKHAIQNTSGSGITTGLMYYNNCSFGRGPTNGGASAFVDYIAMTSGSGTAWTFYDNCTEIGGLQVVGQTAGTNSVFSIPYLNHTNGATVGFDQVVFNNPNFAGGIQPGYANVITVNGGTFGSYQGGIATHTITGSTILTPRLTFFAGTYQFTNCTIQSGPSGYVWGGSNSVQCAVTFTGCSFNFDNYNFAGSGAAVWQFDSASTLTFTNCNLVNNGNTTFYLAKNGSVTTGTFLATGCTFTAASGANMLYLYGSTPTTYTYAAAVAANLIQSSTFIVG